MDNVRPALMEICSHQIVSGYKFLADDEVEIRFSDDKYNDLIIPLSPKMTNDNLLTVFYYYLHNFKGAC